MPFTEVAFGAGFKSIRQFNDTIREIFAATPTELRRARRNGTAPAPGAITLRLAYREPFDAARLFAFLGDRALPGVESWDGDVYARSLTLHHGSAVVELTPMEGYVSCALWLEDVRDLSLAVGRCRRLLDLDADPVAIAAALRRRNVIGSLARRYPGVRVPGAGDTAELAFRAILGQQVSVAAARTLGGRLAAEYGAPLTAPRDRISVAFPAPDVVAGLDPAELGMPRSRARAVISLARALAEGRVELDPGVDPADARASLTALPGIGPWTAAYVTMHALKDPDVLLTSDLGVRRALERLGEPADPKSVERAAGTWQPWRSYATQLLWTSLEEPAPKPRSREREVA